MWISILGLIEELPPQWNTAVYVVWIRPESWVHAYDNIVCWKFKLWVVAISVKATMTALQFQFVVKIVVCIWCAQVFGAFVSAIRFDQATSSPTSFYICMCICVRCIECISMVQIVSGTASVSIPQQIYDNHPKSSSINKTVFH